MNFAIVTTYVERAKAASICPMFSILREPNRYNRKPGCMGLGFDNTLFLHFGMPVFDRTDPEFGSVERRQQGLFALVFDWEFGSGR